MTPTEEALLAQFKDLTAYSDDQHDQVLLLLEQCNWDLNMACGRFFDNQLPSLSSIVAQDQQIPNISPLTDFNRPNVPIRLEHLKLMYPRAIPISSKWKFNPGLVSKPPFILALLFVPKLFLWLLTKLGSLLGIIETEPVNAEFLPSQATIPGNEHDDINDDVKMVLEDSDKEKESFLQLPIWKGEFNDALKLAKNEHQWLLLILVNIPLKETAQCTALTKLFLESIFTKKFKEFLDNNNIIFFLGNVAHPESHLLATTYGVDKVPYVTLMATTQQSGFSMVEEWRSIMNMLLWGTTIDQADVNKLGFKLSKILNRVIEAHDPHLIVLRNEKQERDLARILREEQDRQYEEILAKDRELARKKQEKQERDEIEKQKAFLLQKQREEEEQKQQNKRHQILSSYIKKHLSLSRNLREGKYTKIQFRKPDGSRFVQQFHESQSCKEIFELIAALEYAYELSDEGKDPKEIIEKICSNDDAFECGDDNWTFDFDLISPMPRLRLAPNESLLNEVKALWPNGSLLIEKIVEEEEEEEEE